MDALDIARHFLDSAEDYENPAPMAMAYIMLWHAERIRKFEQAQEEWHHKQRENTPPPPPVMPYPGYPFPGGF
jgi:hypothetical protein